MDVPEPVVRYLEVAYPNGASEVGTAVMEGSGRFRIRPLPWLPVRNTISLHPGVDRVSDMLVGIAPLTVLKVLDAYVDGHGITKVLRKADVGGEIDQGSVHPMLCESLTFPSSWSRMPGFAWEAVDRATARMLLPFQAGTEIATVTFDPVTGLPATYTTPRFKQVGGPKVDWRIDALEWGRSGVVSMPRRLVVTWADEPGPWLDLRFTRVVTDLDISEPIARARAAIAQARGEPSP